MVARVLAALVLSVGVLWAQIPAARAEPIVVDTFEDTYDGSCDDSDCSLRDAVASAPAGATVSLPPGFYPLTITESGGGPADGSILIGRDLSIIAAGPTGSFIDATDLAAPVFDVEAGRTGLRGVTAFGATAQAAGVARIRSGASLHVDHVSVVGGHGRRAGQVLVAEDGSLRAEATLFIDGRSTDGPGSLLVEGAASVEASAFTDGHGARGGALAVGPSGTLDLTDVTIAGNVARGRGGGAWFAGNAMLRGVTIARNRAVAGGGVAVGEGAVVTASHAIVASNDADGHPQCVGDLTSAGHNVERSYGCGFTESSDRRGGDARLERLRANGGPTPSVALRDGSPAIDVGGTCDGRDQRGAPRTDACDAGAYERVLCHGSVVDMVGTAGDDELSGGREPDTFLGLGGDDEFQGSLHDDVGCGGAGDDHLIGGPGDDRLYGARGADELHGEQGDDRCLGGPGRDTSVGCEL